MTFRATAPLALDARFRRGHDKLRNSDALSASASLKVKRRTDFAVKDLPRILVERFYFEVWNRADVEVAREILHRDFKFRASLGPERNGPEGFIDYMRSIHAALGNYTCIIDDLIATENRAAARMTFKGVHRGRFFEVEATGREVQWAGGAFFTIADNQIAELWVLGDVDGLKRQLNAGRAAAFASD